MRPQLLIVDDEEPHVEALCRTLEPEGYDVTGFTSPHDAIAALREHAFDLLLTDLMMPDMDGIALLQRAVELDPDLVGIVMTGHGTVATAVDAMKVGALDYILKPFNLSAIRPVLVRAIKMRRLRLENLRLREAIGLYELSTSLAATLDTETILGKIVDAAVQQSRAQDVSVLVPAPGGDELRVAASRSRGAASTLQVRVPLTPELFAWAERSLQHLSGADDDPTTPSGVPGMSASIIGIPMFVGGRLAGILLFKPSPSPRLIPRGQIKALSILAGAGAAALEVSALLSQLRAAEQRYRRLTEHAADVIFRCELPSARLSYVNPAIEAVTGYNPSDYYETPDLAIELVHPEDASLQRSLFRGEAPEGMAITLRWIRKNGELAWVEQRSVCVRDGSGRIVAVEGIARDVTERRRMETALRRTNEDLRKFAWAASHDLQEPLRTIALYAELLGRTYRGKLDDQADEFLSYAAEGARRIYGMVRELRAFVDAGDVVISPDAVADSGIVVRSIIAELESRIAASRAEIVIGDLPRVRVGESHLSELFRRLLDNALKFRRADRSPRIEITATRDRDSCTFSIADNGIGVAPSYHAQIFDLFQRLHRREDYGGNGMGLPICRRIAEAYGGALWVESEEDQGARFRLKVPAAEAT